MSCRDSLFPIGNSFFVSTNDNGNGGFMNLVPLSNETSLALWTQNSTSMTGTTNNYGATLGLVSRVVPQAFFTTVSSTRFVNHISGGLFGNRRRFVVWADSTVQSDNPYCQIMTANGTTQLFGSKIALPSPATLQTVRSFPLFNGNMVLIHQTGSQFFAREITSEGSVVSSFILNQALSPLTGSTFGWPLSFADSPNDGPRFFAFNRNNAASGQGLLTYTFSPSGQLLSGPTQIDTGFPAAFGGHQNSVFTPSGFLTAFASRDGQVRLVAQNTNGQILSTQIVASGTDADIVYNGLDTLALLYQSAGSVFVRLYEMKTLTPVGCAHPLNALSVSQSLPSGAFLSQDTLSVAWRNSTGYYSRSFRLNEPPFFRAAIPSPLASIGVAGSLDLTPFIGDKEGHSLEFTLSHQGSTSLPPQFAWNGTTLSWNLSAAYPKGPLPFTLSVNDGYYRGVLNATFNVTVVDRPVVVRGNTSLSGFVGDSLILDLRGWITANVTDPDFDSIQIFGVTELPNGFSYNPLTEIISGVVPLGVNGVTQMPIKVSFGTLSESLTANIPVQFFNRPPSVTTLPPQTAIVGVPFSYTLPVVESDPDQDTLINEISLLPNSLAYNPVTRQISGVPFASEVGFYEVLFTVRDLKGGATHTFWNLTIQTPPTNSRTRSKSLSRHSKSSSYRSKSASKTHSETISKSKSSLSPPVFLTGPSKEVNVIVGDSFQMRLDGGNITNFKGGDEIDRTGFSKLTLSLVDPEGDPIPEEDRVSLDLIDPLDRSKGYHFKIEPHPSSLDSRNIIWIVAENEGGLQSHLVIDYTIWTQESAKPFPNQNFQNVLVVSGDFYTGFISENGFSSPLGNELPIGVSVTLTPPDKKLTVTKVNGGYEVSGVVDEFYLVTIEAIDLKTGLAQNVSYTISPIPETIPSKGKGRDLTTQVVYTITTASVVAAVRSIWLGYKYRALLKQKYEEKGVFSVLRTLGRLTFFPFGEVMRLVKEEEKKKDLEMNAL